MSLGKKLCIILLSCLFATPASAAAVCAPPPVCANNQATRWNGSAFECVDLALTYDSCGLVRAGSGVDYLSCPSKMVALALHYEAPTWSSAFDTHGGPEINGIYCCTMTIGAAE